MDIPCVVAQNLQTMIWVEVLQASLLIGIRLIDLIDDAPHLLSYLFKDVLLICVVLVMVSSLQVHVVVVTKSLVVVIVVRDIVDVELDLCVRYQIVQGDELL